MLEYWSNGVKTNAQRPTSNKSVRLRKPQLVLVGDFKSPLLDCSRAHPLLHHSITPLLQCPTTPNEDEDGHEEEDDDEASLNYVFVVFLLVDVSALL